MEPMRGLNKPPVGHPHYQPETPAEEKPEMASTASAKYQELRSKIAEARKIMEDTAKGLFTEMSADLFNENPTLASFGWTQYTPYFNDGDECIFRCHGDYPTVSMLVDGDTYTYDSNAGELLVNGEESNGQTFEDYLRTFKSLGGTVDSFQSNGKTIAYDRAANKITVDGVPAKTYQENHDMFRPLEKAVAAFLNSFEAEDMKVMFGDHTQVTVNRDGKIENEEYQHD